MLIIQKFTLWNSLAFSLFFAYVCCRFPAAFWCFTSSSWSYSLQRHTIDYQYAALFGLTVIISDIICRQIVSPCLRPSVWGEHRVWEETHPIVILVREANKRQGGENTAGGEVILLLCLKQVRSVSRLAARLRACVGNWWSSRLSFAFSSFDWSQTVNPADLTLPVIAALPSWRCPPCRPVKQSIHNS